MAAFLLLAPLLLLGPAAGQADTEMEGCLRLWNTTEGNFSVETTPGTYQANTTYLVTIKDDRNHSNSSGQLLLQALSRQNASVGRWEDAATGICSSVLTAVLNITERESTARWTSPDSNLSSVRIRVFLSLPDNITELRTWVLSRGAETITVPPNSTTRAPSTSPSSGSRAQGSSWLLAALLLLLTGSLLS